MKRICPNCGINIVVNGLGRKPLNIPLKNIRECLIKQRSIEASAIELGCSEAYIFGVLKTNGLRLKDILKKQRQEVSHDKPY